MRRISEVAHFSCLVYAVQLGSCVTIVWKGTGMPSTTHQWSIHLEGRENVKYRAAIIDGTRLS